MKVIKSGDTRQIDCEHCDSVLAIRFKDINYDYVFGHHSYFSVVCGECQRKIELSQKHLPDHWQSRLNRLIAEKMGDDYY